MAWEPDYATAEDLAEYLQINPESVPEGRLELAVTAASRMVDKFAGRQFGKVAEAEQRVYDMWPDYERGVMVATVDDLMDLDGLVVEVDGATVTDYRLEPRNAVAKGRPYTRIMVRRGSTLAATAKWGWSPSWPDTITKATLLQASRLFKRVDAPFGIAGSPDLGGEARLLARVDPDVAVMLAAYRRAGGLG